MDQWQRDIVAAREKVKKLEAARDALAEKCLALQQALDDRAEACAAICDRKAEELFGGWHEANSCRITAYDCAAAIRNEFVDNKCEQGIEPQIKGESR